MDPDALQRAVDLLRRTRFLLVLTGAGISAESGIPTFRGKDGLWNRYDPQDLATPEALQRNPRLVWTWYNWRRGLILQARPNPGHRALADLERLFGDRFLLVTQNVDGLHQRAGSQRVVELHGNIFQERCLSCGLERQAERVYPEEALPPRCPRCGGLMRPGVVFFGEMLPTAALDQALAAAQRADTVLVVGTSAVVYPAAALPYEVRNHGGRILEVNPRATPLTPLAEVSLRALAGQVLPELVRHLQEADPLADPRPQG